MWTTRGCGQPEELDYLDQAAFRRERDRLLFGEWFCAGRADQAERPGSLVVVEVAGESVLLARTRAGELAAHFNVCHHRGSQVVPCPPAAAGQPQATRPARPGRCAALWDLVNRQDWAMCESVQRGMASRAYMGGWFAPMEQPSLDIRRYVLERLGGGSGGSRSGAPEGSGEPRRGAPVHQAAGAVEDGS